MKTKTRNLAVSALLSRMAIRLLATDPSRDKLQQRCDDQWNRLRAQLPADEIRRTEIAARIMLVLAEKLVDCPIVEQVEATLGYVLAVVDGKVHIMDEDEAEAINQ